jgi:hypothetical protein
MKIIPLSDSQQKLISSIMMNQQILMQRKIDFQTCILGSNDIKEETVENIKLSDDGKALFVEFKKEENNNTQKK